MLKNEIYVGDKHFGKKPRRNVVTGELDENQIDAYFRDHHKAIIDRSTWNRCQERMAAEREKKKKGGRTPFVDGEGGVWS